MQAERVPRRNMRDVPPVSMPRVVTLGETMILVHPARFEPVESAVEFRLGIGGAEANVAGHLAALGVAVAGAGRGGGGGVLSGYGWCGIERCVSSGRTWCGCRVGRTRGG